MAECPPHHPLLTDFYQLTMAAGYCRAGRGEDPAVFELFFRSAPGSAGFAVCAGLEGVLDHLEAFALDAHSLAYLEGLGRFSPADLEALASLRFTGDVDAIPEGTPVFPFEPLLRVRARLPEAQIVETAILNRINFETLVATKAARIVQAADGDAVVDYGARRAQGPDGALSASRAAFIGGCAATSNVLAGLRHGIPVEGTMAHSWIMAFPSEAHAFRAYATAFPEDPVLLVDTFDTLESGLPNAIKIFDELRAQGRQVRGGIRIDSGDLAALSIEARQRLGAAGYPEARIVATGDLDERRIRALKEAGASIDVWGVGTRLVTAHDDPALSGVYKLAAVSSSGSPLAPCSKRSDDPDKGSDPDIKVPLRFFDAEDRAVADVLYREGEAPPSGARLGAASFSERDAMTPATLQGPLSAERLFVRVMEKGRRVGPTPSLRSIQERARTELARLPASVTAAEPVERYPVLLSPMLARMKLLSML